MKFKIGDKVWLKEGKIILNVTEVVENECFYDYIIEDNDGDWFVHVTESKIHETAETMFEKIGYKVVSSKDEDVLMYFLGGRFVYFILNDTHIYGKNKGYGCYEINENGNKVQTTIIPNLHLAIHQQLIELGWIE